MHFLSRKFLQSCPMIWIDEIFAWVNPFNQLYVIVFPLLIVLIFQFMCPEETPSVAACRDANLTSGAYPNRGVVVPSLSDKHCVYPQVSLPRLFFRATTNTNTEIKLREIFSNGNKF